MKKLIFILILLFPVFMAAQNIQVITHGLTKADTLGKEIIFDFEVINTSNEEQIVFEVRTINNLPPEWTSSLCFGELCFPPSFDSIATSPPNPEPPLQPGDTLITSLHVFTQTNHGTANVQIQIS